MDSSDANADADETAGVDRRADPPVTAVTAVTAVIALGSNLGDREATLRSAIAALETSIGVDVLAVSRIYSSPAVTTSGIDESKPEYLNAVAMVATQLGPEPLLDLLQRVEADHGRVRLEHWGDRTLDLDLVDYAGRMLDSERLTLPHPHAAERDFVLRPWLDVDPDAVLAGIGPVADALRRLEG